MKHTHNLLKALSIVTAIACFYNSCYSITDIVSAEETSSDFDPYVFYEEILNEKRPEYAKSYRILDLDADNFEELIIYESYVLAVYTIDKNLNQPKLIFSQTGGFPYYQICENGFVKYSLSPNWHSKICGDIYYRIINGRLSPVIGYIIDFYTNKCYKTENSELLLHLNKNLEGWLDISSEIEGVSKLSYENYVKKNNEIIGVPNVIINLWTESFYAYDSQREFEQNYKGESVTITGRYGYDDLLKRYKKDVVSTTFKDMSIGSLGRYYLETDIFSEELRIYISQNRSDFCFILRDINEDGIRELITGGLDENGDFKFFDLYTIYDNRIIHLAACAANCRTVYSLRKDNKIIELIFGGAANQLYKIYDISKDSLELEGVLQLENQLYYNYVNFGTASENKKEINQNTYEEILKNQYSGELQQDFIMLKDWYPGMRINEDPDGDANDDGEINMLDVLLVHKHILSLSDEAKLNTSYIDINKDNTVNVLDLMLLKRSILAK